jgi:hypothetical protein
MAEPCKLLAGQSKNKTTFSPLPTVGSQCLLVPWGQCWRWWPPLPTQWNPVPCPSGSALHAPADTRRWSPPGIPKVRQESLLTTKPWGQLRQASTGKVTHHNTPSSSPKGHPFCTPSPHPVLTSDIPSAVNFFLVVDVSAPKDKEACPIKENLSSIRLLR